MNREIKFRAWNGKKIMPYVSILGLSEGFAYGHDRSWLHNSMDWDSDEEFIEDPTLMQFTGLKDKNGKEIYEGDVVNYLLSHDSNLNVLTSQIKWHNYAWRLNGLWLLTEVHSVEVIGNIHQNPELLK